MQRLNKHLSTDQVNEIEVKIALEIERIKSNNKEKDFNLSATERKNEVDEANENIMLSYTARQTSRENIYLKKLLKSLDKIKRGEYGICDDCGAEIPFRRLHARITSDLCITCKEDSEQVESGTIFGKRSHSLGKGLQVSS